MTKLEAILSKSFTRRERCVWFGSVINTGNHAQIETICNHYNISVDSFVYAHTALDVIKAEYGKRIDNLKYNFIEKLMIAMIQQQMDVDNIILKEINECLQNYFQS